MSFRLRCKRRFLEAVMPRPTKVILLGTTAGTTWRQTLIETLVANGVRKDQIINPHLPKGQSYGPANMAAERNAKRNPRMLIVVYVCPAVLEQGSGNHEMDEYRKQMVGPISMFEVGKMAYAASHRTGIVLAHDLFTRGKRLKAVADEISGDFGGEPPFFADLDSVASWVVRRLVRGSGV